MELDGVLLVADTCSSFQSGVIQCVPKAKSRSDLGKETDFGLFEYFLTTYGHASSAKFQVSSLKTCFLAMQQI